MNVTLLAGGVGGAKMAHGLQQVLAPGELTVVVNVADDFEHFGLCVSPDLDTVTYTLAGLANPQTGWGIAGDTRTALGMLARYGEPTWFTVGDADLATHVHRTRLLREGRSLTDATRSIAAGLGVPSGVLPATDERVRTKIETDEGELDFQAYFVGRRHEPEVRGLRFQGVDAARPTEAVLNAVGSAELLVIGPSNPLVSIGPILALPGMREAWRRAPARKVGVSGIVGGQALRGPADRMLGSLGHEATARGVARLYADLVDRFVIDDADGDLASEIEELGLAVDVLPTVMRSEEDRAGLARAILRLQG